MTTRQIKRKPIRTSNDPFKWAFIGAVLGAILDFFLTRFFGYIFDPWILKQGFNNMLGDLPMLIMNCFVFLILMGLFSGLLYLAANWYIKKWAEAGPR